MSKWLRKTADCHPYLFWIGSIILLGEVCYKAAAVTFLEGNDWAVAFLRLSITLLTILMVREMYNGEFSMGFRRKNFLKGFALMLLPAALFLAENIIVTFPHGVYLDSAITYTIDNMGVGLFEEVLVRGFLLGNMMHYWKHDKNRVWKSIFFSSLIFGLLHMGNLLSGANLISVLFQVFYATAMGIAFGAVYIRTKNLWSVVLIHGIVDITGELGRMTYPVNGGADVVQYEQGLEFGKRFMSLLNGLMPIVMMAAGSVVAIIFAVYFVRKSKRNEIEEIWS